MNRPFSALLGKAPLSARGARTVTHVSGSKWNPSIGWTAVASVRLTSPASGRGIGAAEGMGKSPGALLARSASAFAKPSTPKAAVKFCSRNNRPAMSADATDFPSTALWIQGSVSSFRKDGCDLFGRRPVVTSLASRCSQSQSCVSAPRMCFQAKFTVMQASGNPKRSKQLESRFLSVCCTAISGFGLACNSSQMR